MKYSTCYYYYIFNTMNRLYFYTSSEETDKCKMITIFTASEKRAMNIVLKKFKEYGYKGLPIRVFNPID